MSWGTAVLGLLGVLFLFNLLMNLRAQGTSQVLEGLKKEEFQEGVKWFAHYIGALKPAVLMSSRHYQVWYFKTLQDNGEVTESAIFYRFSFAPLHVFYKNGEPTGVLGGRQFENILDSEGTKRNLKDILKELRQKEVKFSSYSPLPSAN